MKKESIYVQGLNMEITFLVGRDKSENSDLLDYASQNDLWFHASETSSCHVVALLEISKTDKKTFDKKSLKYIVKQGALLCKRYTTKLSKEKDVKIIYTTIQNVKKTNIAGMVTTSCTKSIIC
jgi:predicted ribosome quality control (RQC) complex YloA/Tae2 family protein